jgi:hypothetical protein
MRRAFLSQRVVGTRSRAIRRGTSINANNAVCLYTRERPWEKRTTSFETCDVGSRGTASIPLHSATPELLTF